jgi:hypothetical protein
VAEYLPKRLQLLDHRRVVVPEQLLKHLARRKHQLVFFVEVPAGQKQGSLVGRSVASCEEDLQVVSVKAEQHQAGGEGNAEIGIFLGIGQHARAI